MSALRAAVVGGAGYIGGELIRLLLGHPELELVATTSNSLAGKRVDGAHPNLRGLTDLTFVTRDALEPCDVLFLAMPHREVMGSLHELSGLAETVVDLSGDFRLADPADYERQYGVPHEAPDEIGEFVLGLPEMDRAPVVGASRISVPGCMATAAMLALHPLAADGLLTGQVTVDARTGSSGSGATAGPQNTHAERSGTMRVFAPDGHRHESEIEQSIGLPVQMTATGVEAVRGVQALCHIRLVSGTGERDVRASYRRHYADEPFVRLVTQRRGAHRLPEPKILAGSNFCDVGFALRPDEQGAVVIGALDNLVKGGSGSAVQAVNVRYGWPESLGLTFPGLHPN